MHILGSIIAGFHVALTPANLLYCVIGATLGTVVGILKAFQSMSMAGTGGFKVVSQGIAAALVATAAGLLVAIYAIIAYNYFVSRVGSLAIEYKVFCEEFLLVLGEYAKAHEVPPAVTGTVPPSPEKNASPS